MDFFPTQLFHRLRLYWRRRSYQRLDRSPNHKTLRVVRLGGGNSGSPRRRRLIKVRPLAKLKLRMFSPLRLLVKLRDAYVDAMLGIRGPSASGSQMFGDGRVPRGRKVKESSKEFERRMILEIYKSIAASRGVSVY
ncbi:hypothetical protein QJS10_CPB14g00223 [Acorus calamus]|uniref:Uncharacterized protein n=1 Tax=Acorus calamus TaxID=4465 RepID=A0AAV9DDE8_ACOCL|nr:hypothetical protein QJS10_CPB14g00240 [Acorus calamus]KAK1299012.1 hypothetical protein QJS10_CPB14g00223 [Acorus calamus]